MNHIDQRIVEFIQSHHVLSLAVMHQQAIWAANLFYYADFSVPAQASLIILSDLSTRHGQWMQQSKHVAGTIASQPKQVKDIRGIQFKGTVTLLNGTAADEAKTAFYHQFSEVKNKDVPVWRIDCDYLKYTDNSLGFGTKLRWEK